MRNEGEQQPALCLPSVSSAPLKNNVILKEGLTGTEQKTFPMS
jgi:hypothetical protein